VVVESNSSRYKVGDIVSGITGWQEWTIADENNHFSSSRRGSASISRR